MSFKLAELRQIELALASRLMRLDKTPEKRRSRMHEHHVTTTRNALMEAVNQARGLDPE